MKVRSLTVGSGDQLLSLFRRCCILPANASSQKEPYKIGAVFSVTGVGSFLGDPEKKTAEMIADEINRQGA